LHTQNGLLDTATQHYQNATQYVSKARTDISDEFKELNSKNDNKKHLLIKDNMVISKHNNSMSAKVKQYIPKGKSSIKTFKSKAHTVLQWKLPERYYTTNTQMNATHTQKLLPEITHQLTKTRFSIDSQKNIISLQVNQIEAYTTSYSVLYKTVADNMAQTSGLLHHEIDLRKNAGDSYSRDIKNIQTYLMQEKYKKDSIALSAFLCVFDSLRSKQSAILNNYRAINTLYKSNLSYIRKHSSVANDSIIRYYNSDYDSLVVNKTNALKSISRRISVIAYFSGYYKPMAKQYSRLNRLLGKEKIIDEYRWDETHHYLDVKKTAELERNKKVTAYIHDMQQNIKKGISVTKKKPKT